MSDSKELSGSEALYGFCGWLTTRKEVTKMGAKHDASEIADLVAMFVSSQELSKPREGWSENMKTFPS